MLEVFANKELSGILEYDEENKEFIFNYKNDKPVSLIMPYRLKSYVSKYNLHPVFDMNIPEGYLFLLLKNMLIKRYGKINDFIILKHLAGSIDGHLTYKSNVESKNTTFELEEILKSKEQDLFSKLVNEFFSNSAVSGVQPKVLAPLNDRITLSTKEYIIKSFSDEFPHLAENEYFCMKAVSYAGIQVPEFWLSENKKLFIIEKFTYIKNSNEFYGFEEFCGLLGFTRDGKYNGSYERVTKAIFRISSDNGSDLKDFFKMIVMNYLLKNGDAHLKNFGILYTSDFKTRFLAPAYDVVNTVIYMPDDKPALSLSGKKIWLNKKKLLQFGEEFCFLDREVALEEFNTCVAAVEKIKKEIEIYIKSNPDFTEFGNKFLNILNFSLNENINNSYKELPDGIL